MTDQPIRSVGLVSVPGRGDVQVRVSIQLRGSEPLLTTENASEPLIDLLDGFLYYCGRRDDGLDRPAPLWQAIYGDVGGCFGDDYGKDFSVAEGHPPERLVRRLARQAIFGNSIGWIAPQLVLGEYEAAGRLIRSARSARLEHLPCFRGGLPCTDALDSTGERTGVFLSASPPNSNGPTARGLACPRGRRREGGRIDRGPSAATVQQGQGGVRVGGAGRRRVRAGGDLSADPGGGLGGGAGGGDLAGPAGQLLRRAM